MPQAQKTPAGTVWRITRHTKGRRARMLADKETRNLFISMLALMSWAMRFEVLAFTVLPHRIDYVIHDVDGVLGRATQQYHVHLVRTLQRRFRSGRDFVELPEDRPADHPAFEAGGRCVYQQLFTFDHVLEHCTRVMTLPERLGMSRESAIVTTLPHNLHEPLDACLDEKDPTLYLETHLAPHIEQAGNLTLAPRPQTNPNQWHRALTAAVQKRLTAIFREAQVDESVGFPRWEPDYGDQPPPPPHTPALDRALAEHDKPRRERQQAEQGAWYAKYMAARIAFCEGRHNVLFPPETFYFDERFLMRCGKSRTTIPTRPRWFLWLEDLKGFVAPRDGPI